MVAHRVRERRWRRRPLLGPWAVAVALLAGGGGAEGGGALAWEGAPPEGNQTPVAVEPGAATGRRESEGGAKAERRRLEKEWFEHFERGELAAAEAKLRRLTEIDRKNFVPWYNLACVLAAQGRAEDAMSALETAISWGFSDLRHLRTDPHLEPLRSLAKYEAIIAGWDRILDAQVEARLKALSEAIAEGGGRYITERDETLRLAFLSSFDAAALERTRAEIAQLARWWEEEVMSAAGTAEERGPDPWVIVMLPTPRDYARWALAKFGPGWRQIGGSYSDDEKLLVSQDLGGTLRHEFWHVLHWRDQRRRGQVHPIWIMEGLCSLVEDVEVGEGGRMRVLPSWRTNMAKRRERNGSLMPWEVLFDREHKRFVTSSPLAHYAEARSIFLYLADQGKLAEWYAAYVRGYAEDSTGAAAMVAVFGKPLGEIEKDFRKWLRALPMVAEEIPYGGATLPFEYEVAAGGGGQGGDGITIVSIPPRPRATKGEPRPTRLRLRDVVTHIDDQPVRDTGELVRALSKYSPGDEVEVTFRRGKVTGTARVVLVPKK